MITKNNLLFSLILIVSILGTSSCSKNSISDLQSKELKVDIATAGSLSSLIPDNEKSQIENLTLTGELNGLDVRTINTLDNLKHLDMSGLKIITDNVPYYNEGDRVYYTINNVLPSLLINNLNIKQHLKSIICPNSVTKIGDCALHYCTSLTAITIPNSVTSIGNVAFRCCYSLTEINIPNSVTSIGSSAFSECQSISTITIPNSVTSIGDDAFSNCTSLTAINIPNSVTNIGNKVFYSCQNMSAITIPNSVTSIGDGAFYYCIALKSINIPNSVTSIGDFSFSGCTALAAITIPNSVTKIGRDAFDSSVNIKEIHLKNKTPIKAPSFSIDYFICKLYVPRESVNLYKKAPGWSYFYNIIGE